MEGDDRVREGVRDYYGKRLKGSKDLKTSACCCSTPAEPEVAEALSLIDGEILDRCYGCGSPIPPLLDGLTVLDLGCGTGRDVYVISKLAGQNGRVIGVDMTPEQLSVAERHKGSQMARFGYSKSNVEFVEGCIEDLDELGIEDGSVDLVVSNCVINLSPDKGKVFSGIHRVLREGGELYFSDIFADRRVPKEAYEDPVVHGECLGGAMYIGDFRRAMRQAGFLDFRETSVAEVSIDEGIRSVTGDASFTSRTVRAFKLDSLEDACEDYGQSAVYMGNIPGHPDFFDLDRGHRFRRGEWARVCGNTASMLSETRYSEAFLVSGDRRRHYGAFGRHGGRTDGPGCC
jgi:ubiquinone/menaquinone biosynthesis C-methylase UbiE